MSPDEAGELGEVETLGAKMIRPDRRISGEDLIASELAAAVLSEPIGKIRHVCEALMLLDEEERERAGITADEVKVAEKLYKLALMFQNAFVDMFLSPHDARPIERSMTIQFPFSLEDAEEWKEWLSPPGLTCMWYYQGEEDREQKLKTQKELEGKPDWMTHYRLIHGQKIIPDGVKSLQTYFTVKAMPTAARLLRKIIGLVSPDSYQAALRAMRGAKHGKAQL